VTDKLFLFDFDGVIVDSLAFYRESSGRCFAGMGITDFEDDEAFLDLFDDNFYVALAKRDIDIEEFRQVARRVGPTVDDRIIVPFPGVPAVLEQLAADHPLLVVSSNSGKTIGKILSRSGCDHYFDAVLGSDFLFSKADKIAHAMEEWKGDRDQTFFIGDTVGDMREAQEAGVRTVAVTWGWHSRERLAGAAPDYLIDDPVELFQL